MTATFHDITHDTQENYVLDTPGTHVFFLFNRSADLTLELATPQAEAFVFGLFTGKNTDDFSLSIRQHHRAPQTRSHVLIKSVGNDAAQFRYQGTIRIENEAVGSDASQTNRNLLLSAGASASSKPELEILTDDVTCRHAATTGRPDPEALWYMQSRGLSETDAVQLIAKGFVDEIFQEVGKFGRFEEVEEYRQNI